MKTKLFLLLIIFLVTGIISIAFQEKQDHKVLFEKAKYTMETKADLKEAINLFESLIKTYPNEKEYVAKSLLYQGMCHEKLGNQEAVKKYQRLVDNYPGQKNEVALARERLSRLILIAKEISETPLKPKFTKIKIPTKLSWSVKLSPDGKELALVSDNKLWRMPLSGNLGPDISGIPVQLNTGNIEVEWTGLSWSGDGKWIAFNEYPQKDDQGNYIENQSIYIISATGGKPKKLIENYRSERVVNYRMSLSPNGKNLAFSSIEENKQHIFSTSVDNVIPKQLTEMEAREPVFSPDGKYIAFVKDKNKGRVEGDLGLWIIPSEGGTPQLLAGAGKASSPIWSPDGKMITYLDNSVGNQINIVPFSETGVSSEKVIRIEAPEGTEEVRLLAGWTPDNKIGALLVSKQEFGLYTLPAKGGQAAMILNDTRVSQPRWSHDGKQIYYVTPPKEGINRSYRRFLASVSANGGKGTPLQTNIDGESVHQFAFQSGNRVSPDGKWIITSTWTSADTNTVNVHWPTSKIWKVSVDSEDAVQITNTPGNFSDMSPCWSPDGKKIAFVRFQLEEGKDDIFGSSPKIYSMNSVGGEPELLVSISGKYVGSLIWLSDGRTIAYLTKEIKEPHTKNLNLYDVEKKESRIIEDLESANLNHEMAWSPDSKRIALNDKDGKVIKIITLADGSIEDISTGLVDVNIYHLDWSPDGKRFVFFGWKGGNAEFWFLEDFLPLEKLSQEEDYLLVKKEDKEFKIRQAWADYELYSEGAPSPDGRYISYVHWDTGDLGILEIATGKKSRLTNKGSWDESDEFAEYSRWSPDSKQIVYDWYNEEGFIELRIIRLDGSKPRILYKNEEVDWARTYGWSPNGKQILACFSRKGGAQQIVLVSVNDGSVRVLKILEKEWPKNMNFSPDGRYIVYDFPQKENSQERDISLLSTDGSREITLVEHPANDLLLGWAPDGKNILFASDRTGTLSAWLIAVNNGKPQGTPKLVKPDIGQFATMGFTRDGSFYYNFGGEFTRDIFSVKMDPESGEILNQPKKLIKNFEGYNQSPDYSPDGKHLAYVRRILGDVLCIHSLETGEEQEFKLKLKQIESPRWSPDGRSILIAGQGNNNLWKLYQVDTQTGNLTPLASSQDDMRAVGNHEWSPDGKAIFYGQRSPKNNRTQIIHREIKSGTEKELFLGSSNNQFYLSCSPNGKWLSFFVKTGKELKIMPAGGGEIRVLFRCKQSDHLSALRWTADGKYILFVIRPLANSLRQPEQNKCSLWRIPIEGGEPENLGLEINYTEHLSIHPNGKHIAFYNISAKIGEVWVMENFLSEK